MKRREFFKKAGAGSAVLASVPALAMARPAQAENGGQAENKFQWVIGAANGAPRASSLEARTFRGEANQGTQILTTGNLDKEETSMKSLKTFTKFATLLCGLLLSLGRAQAADISGRISSTLTIFEDSQLVGNVTCTVVGAPCIKFGTDDIELRLNGFTMTGLADPTTGCGPTSASTVPLENGISTDGHSDVEILGPGLVQNFRRNGVLVLNGSTKVKVRHVTASTNCISGILLINNASDNDIEENVAVRNGHLQFACGGIELTGGSNNNRIRRNETSGNGYAGPPNNDYGIDLDDSHGNLVEENSAVGNTNGILVFPTSTGNVVRRNVITGNPPLQVSLSFGAFGGVDIQNLSPAGANTFEDNLCVTSNVSGLCPNFPDFAGHKNAGK